MITWRLVRTTVFCLAVSVAAHAATLDDLEAQMRAVVAQRQAAQAERARLVAEAATLANSINAAQSPQGNALRANSSQERQLRDFDRLAGKLDAADRALKTYESNIARLRRAFDAEIEKQSKELSAEGLRSPALRAADLETARRRVDDLLASRVGFRALLIVKPTANDTVADLDTKLAVLAAEQERGTSALAAVERDLSVLDARGLVTRRLLDQVEATARGAPQDLRLVQRQVDDVQQRLRDMETSRAALQHLRETIVQGLSDVQQQAAQCRARRSELIAPGKG